LKDTVKNSILKKHFLNPVGMKRLENPTFHAICKSDTCSDVVRMAVIVGGDGTIADIGTEVYGCGYSIAGASLFNSAAKNTRLDEVIARAETAVAGVIDDVPETNRRCVQLSLLAFELIYEQYKQQSG
jgi:NifU-like protein involved in Fe-S cluster formation